MLIVFCIGLNMLMLTTATQGADRLGIMVPVRQVYRRTTWTILCLAIFLLAKTCLILPYLRWSPTHRSLPLLLKIPDPRLM